MFKELCLEKEDEFIEERNEATEAKQHLDHSLENGNEAVRRIEGELKQATVAEKKRRELLEDKYNSLKELMMTVKKERKDKEIDLMLRKRELD